MAKEEKSRKSGPSKKLGVKYLDDYQLTNSFPDWQALLYRIEEQRFIAAAAAEAPKDLTTTNSHFPQMYDNLYAILGGRGTGKSSVILSLQHKLDSPRYRDILLPIITPEIISERECSILGWIMSATESVVSTLEHRIRKLEQSGGEPGGCLDDFFRNCQFQQDNPLRKSYHDLFRKSIQTSNNFDASTFSAEEAVGYRMEQSRRQYKLIHDLDAFWGKLTDNWYAVNRRVFGKDAEMPLIILMFDDIDLVPERSMELLNTTFQYLTSPNIVIILTAAEKVLRDVIRLKLYERMAESNVKSLMKDALPTRMKEWDESRDRTGEDHPNSIGRMADEFYDKVIPASSRYRLRRYTTIQEKKLYAYSDMKQSFVAPTEVISTPLEDFLIWQVGQLAQTFRDRGGTGRNFLLAREEPADGIPAFREAYLTIFGDKSRRIANGCLEVMNTVARLSGLADQIDDFRRAKADGRPAERLRELKQGMEKETLQSLRHLARALMLSKEELNGCEGLESGLLQLRPDYRGIFINYEIALRLYYVERQEIQECVWTPENPTDNIASNRLRREERRLLGQAKQRAAALITLLFFIEGLLLTMDATRKHLHGYNVLNRLLNADVRRNSRGDLVNMTFFPRNQSTEDFLDAYPLALEHIDRYVDVDINDRGVARDYLEDIFRSRENLNAGELRRMLASFLKTDQEWVENVLRMLVIRYSGISLVGPDFMRVSKEVQEREVLFVFMTHLTEARQNAARSFLESENLIQQSSTRMDGFHNLISREDDWDTYAAPLQKALASNMDASPTLQSWDDRLLSIQEVGGAPLDECVKSYTVARWRSFLRQRLMEPAEAGTDHGLKQLELCYQLVLFVNEVSNEDISLICTQSEIFLSQQDLRAVRICLNRIDSFNEESRRRKQNLSRALTVAFAAPSSVQRNYVGDEGDQLTLAVPEDVWRVPTAPLVDYLALVRSAVVEQQQAEYNIYTLYDQPDFSGFYDLLEYLAPTLPGSSEPLDSAPDGGLFPMSGRVILDMRMLELLYPYYFAAKMQIALATDTADDSPMTENGASQGDQQGTLDRKLQGLFNALARDVRQPTALQRIMRGVRTELARNYYRDSEV